MPKSAPSRTCRLQRSLSRRPQPKSSRLAFFPNELLIAIAKRIPLWREFLSFRQLFSRTYNLRLVTPDQLKRRYGTLLYDTLVVAHDSWVQALLFSSSTSNDNDIDSRIELDLSNYSTTMDTLLFACDISLSTRKGCSAFESINGGYGDFEDHQLSTRTRSKKAARKSVTKEASKAEKSWLYFCWLRNFDTVMVSVVEVMASDAFRVRSEAMLASAKAQVPDWSTFRLMEVDADDLDLRTIKRMSARLATAMKACLKWEEDAMRGRKSPGHDRRPEQKYFPDAVIGPQRPVPSTYRHLLLGKGYAFGQDALDLLGLAHCCLDEVHDALARLHPFMGPFRATSNSTSSFDKFLTAVLLPLVAAFAEISRNFRPGLPLSFWPPHLLVELPGTCPRRAPFDFTYLLEKTRDVAAFIKHMRAMRPAVGYLCLLGLDLPS
ncbi:hypothetical protein BJ508DRAFT_314689 [Ascobolus immersus RN42]|uniref:Uncharacterized protein n=1 Tax=Ascobolus immersus RN42 TaxID=1160509 RepID=A0A3N4HE60_ASCIM|nr:hypothetical protein BJ508DRAFT_314689 [Ascobolus immersus RN42]